MGIKMVEFWILKVKKVKNLIRTRKRNKETKKLIQVFLLIGS